jgi:kynurenine 3-monooxygenase
MKIAIVGAGLTGSLLACFLARRGLAVTLYERRPDPRLGQVERGRSINLAISERGLDALRRIGLVDEVMADALPMKGRMIHPVEGPLDFQPYSASGDRAINSISRGALNNALLSAAEAAPGVSVHFDHRLVELDSQVGRMVFETAAGKVSAQADVVLGADGAGSAVRGQLLAEGIVAEDVDFLDYGYKELSIPATDGEFALDPGALHIWPRGTSMMIALPNPDRSFTCTLFWPTGSFDALTTPAGIEQHFRSSYPDLLPLAPDLVDDYRQNPVGVLGTVHTMPWQVHGRTALIGDAAHAIVPFYGQGANCAFEDVVELDRCLDDTAGSWARALPLFEARRRENTEAIAGMALANFVEMRDKVASPLFRLTKRVEHALERLLPGYYVSRYELVSFSTTPYAEVRRRVHRQHQILAAAALAAGAVLLAAARRLPRHAEPEKPPRRGLLPRGLPARGLPARALRARGVSRWG